MAYYLAYELTDACRAKLLRDFKPSYQYTLCHHVTIAFNVAADTPLPETPKTICLTAYHDDGYGIEAFAVSVDGMKHKANGEPFHLTHSYRTNVQKPRDLWGDTASAFYRAVDSNILVAQNLGLVVPLERPISLEVKPKLLVSNTK